MKEFEIRPADIFEEYLRLSAHDVEQYFLNKSDRVYRNCPGCGSDSNQKAFMKM